MNDEIWKTIEDYPEYEVSIYGEIYSKRKQECLIPQNNPRGYSIVTLYNENGPQQLSVHRLVANAFIPNPNDKPQINHKDGYKRNNRDSNLEWCTPKENMRHAFKKGLGKHAGGTPKKKVRIVETGEIFESISDCAKAINGNKKYQTHHGLHFEEVL